MALHTALGGESVQHDHLISQRVAVAVASSRFTAKESALEFVFRNLSRSSDDARSSLLHKMSLLPRSDHQWRSKLTGYTSPMSLHIGETSPPSAGLSAQPPSQMTQGEQVRVRGRSPCG